MKLTEISKIISHALRHEPWIYELELDSEGWVPIAELITALNDIETISPKVDLSIIEDIINKSDKPRFEIIGDKIRALYGHSTPNKLVYTPSEPPEFLYHGTTELINEIIQQDGLKPMNRQYVHFSTSQNIAQEVAKRKGQNIKILKINSIQAHKEGYEFYKGNKYVWLCSYLPSKFISKI